MLRFEQASQLLISSRSWQHENKKCRSGNAIYKLLLT